MRFELNTIDLKQLLPCAKCPCNVEGNQEFMHIDHDISYDSMVFLPPAEQLLHSIISF